jgi:hypothetical protein
MSRLAINVCRLSPAGVRPSTTAESIKLSRVAASNAEVYRAAEAQAKAEGLRLEVETMEEALGRSDAGSNGNGSGGAGSA